jgi:hypothetical protein
MHLLERDETLKIGDKNYVYLLIKFISQILDEDRVSESVAEDLKHVS